MQIHTRTIYITHFQAKGLLYSYVDSTHDLWQLTLDELSLLFERASTLSVAPGANDFTRLFGTYMERVDCLARRSAPLPVQIQF